jgi:anti-sigma factor RsiW
MVGPNGVELAASPDLPVRRRQWGEPDHHGMRLVSHLPRTLVSNVVLRLLQTRRVRVVALVLQLILLLTLVLGHLPGILGIWIGVAAAVLVHARSFSEPQKSAFEQDVRDRALRNPVRAAPDPAVPAHSRASDQVACRRRKVCRPTLPDHAVSTSSPAPDPSARSASG